MINYDRVPCTLIELAIMAEELILALLLVRGLLAVLASLGGLQFHTPLALEAFALLCPQLAWQVLTPNWCQVATLSHVMCLFSASFLSLSKRKSHGQFQTRSRAHSRPWENVTTSGRQLGDIICKRSGRQLDSTTSGETLEALEATGRIGRQHLGSRIWVTGDNCDTTGRQLGDNWNTMGRHLGDSWETSGRPHVGDKWELWETSWKPPGDNWVGENIWQTTSFGRQVKISARQLGDEVARFHKTLRHGWGKGGEVEIPSCAPRDWNEVNKKVGSAMGDTVFYTMKKTVTVGDSVAGNVQGARHSGGQSGRQSGRRSAVGDTVGDKVGDTVGDKVGDTVGDGAT